MVLGTAMALGGCGGTSREPATDAGIFGPDAAYGGPPLDTQGPVDAGPRIFGPDAAYGGPPMEDAG
ncbi:MAG: hypothetical protein ACHQ53_02490 [Polyangiales bacterium]